MDVGATGDQKFSHSHLALERRHDQGRGVILALKVDVHTLAEKLFDRANISAPHNIVQRARPC